MKDAKYVYGSFFEDGMLDAFRYQTVLLLSRPLMRLYNETCLPGFPICADLYRTRSLWGDAAMQCCSRWKLTKSVSVSVSVVWWEIEMKWILEGDVHYSTLQCPPIHIYFTFIINSTCMMWRQENTLGVSLKMKGVKGGDKNNSWATPDHCSLLNSSQPTFINYSSFSSLHNL